IEINDGVLFPRTGFLLVGEPAPQIDYGLTFPSDAARGAYIGTACEIGFEGIADRGEFFCGEALYCCFWHGCSVCRCYAKLELRSSLVFNDLDCYSGIGGALVPRFAPPVSRRLGP